MYLETVCPSREHCVILQKEILTSLHRSNAIPGYCIVKLMQQSRIKMLVLKVYIQGIRDRTKINDYVLGARSISIQVNSVNGKEKLKRPRRFFGKERL